jgi:hypothetical protein
VGNLLLHLAGNLRQWIVSAIGSAPDQRDRSAEFAATGALGRAELLGRLATTITEADALLAGIGPERLLAPIRVQGRDVTVQAAIYHAVEHLAMHAGQIIYIVKLRTGVDLAFYRMVDGIPRPAWPDHPEEGSA